jgi:D-sedoheptulose 7-phosphate isomerase
MTPALTQMFAEARRLAEWLESDTESHEIIERMADEMASALAEGGRLLSCGNGGSLCDAMHFAEELSGRYRDDRPALSALALTDPGHMSCVANDFGYDDVFARAVSAHGRAGDVLLAFSTSGNSPNVLAALRTAREVGMRAFGLLGRDGGGALALCDRALVVPARDSGRIQEIHIKVVHSMIELIERRLHPENYAD